nr:hypothetical protein [Tanacetum cinerariifolium]
MCSASSAVTYTSVYTDSESGRVFCGADEELSDGGSPRVIVYGYDGLPMLPIAPPSPDYPHDPDFMPEPIYPEYIPLEDEHVLPDEEQPLPSVVSPTVESPEYVVESDPEEDPEEYEDDETEDGLDEDEDDKEEEEEEDHLASADSAIVIPTDELPSPPEGTEPVIPPPFTDTATTGARITVQLQAAISFPPEAEVERLLAMPTPSPSPLTSLLPPYAGERDWLDAQPQLHYHHHHYHHLYTCHHLYEVGESFTTRPIGGRGIDYGFVSTLDAKARRRGIEKVGYGIRDTWMQQTEIADLQETDRRRQAQMVETLRVMGDMRREMGDMQAKLLAMREQPRRARHPGGDARVPNHREAPRDADSNI